MYRHIQIVLVLLIAAVLSGCNSQGEFSTSPVHGTVTYDGKPVFEGTIDFIPIAGNDTEMMGKPAAATITEDGTYQAGTYASSDGVVPGRKQIRYSAPLPADTRENAGSKPSPFLGLEIEPSEVEIVPGKNEINFELKKPAKSR
ncbi:hypothetical protein GC197_07925 [bacterium]|nr:hypothetical protein [bacterium]